jgi:beta-N-acetylhexosaminidase
MIASRPSYAQLQLTTAQRAWVDQTLAQLTLEEKIGQVIFAVAPGVFTNQDSDAFQKIREAVQTYHVGGYHIEAGDPATAALLISRIQQLAKVPLLVTADFEGGAGFQMAGATRFPRAMAIAATGNVQYAYDAAKFTAEEAKAMGFSINFYPDVDVNNNPQNPIINIRSFGESPQLVGEFGAAYVKGTQDAGIIATAKHFPGHGDSSVDSHLELPVLNFDRARLETMELPPFRAAIKAGVGAVMTGHLYLPQFEKTAGVPASLSEVITTNLLRRELGYEGLIFTDALPMHAITANFGADQAAVMAIKAGADVALEPVDVPKAFAALKTAVSQQEISVERLNNSVHRLLAAKAWAGLNTRSTPDLSRIDRFVGNRTADEKAQEIIEHTLTLVKDDKKALPLKLRDDEDVLLVNIVDAANPENPGNSGLTFRDEFGKRHMRILFASVTPNTSRSEADLIRRLATHYKTVVVSCFIRVAPYKGSIGLNDVQQNLLRELARHDGPSVFALFGTPYLLNDLPELASYALAFEYYPGAERAMVRAILGEIPFQGRLPVTVGNFPVGFSLKK